MRQVTGGWAWSTTLALLVCAMAGACGDNRGGDVPEIRRKLEQFKGVRVVDAWGFDEMWPLFGPEAIRAELEVGQGGHLVLCNLTLESFSGDSPFIIARIGDWVPMVTAERDSGKTRYVAGCPNSVDVAADSAFLELVPFKLRSVGDVIENYDRLDSLMETWPTCPRSRVAARDGSGAIEFWKTRFLESYVRGEVAGDAMSSDASARTEVPRHVDDQEGQAR